MGPFYRGAPGGSGWFASALPFTSNLAPSPSSNRWTDFHALWLKQRASTWGWLLSWLEWRVTSFGGICPKTPKIGMYRQFQAHEMLQYLNSNPKLQTGSEQNLKTKLRPTIALRGWSALPQTNETWRMIAIFKKSIWHHNYVADVPISMKFGTPI